MEGFKTLIQQGSASELQAISSLLLRISEGEKPDTELMSDFCDVVFSSSQGSIKTEDALDTLRNLRSRTAILEDLQEVTNELRGIASRFEEALKRIRFQIRQNRKDPELWELYGRLLPKQSQVSRRFITGEAALQPGGGGEKWNLSRLEQVLSSLLRFAQEAHETYRELRLSKLPPAREVPGFSPRLTSEKTFEEILILFRHLPWSGENLGNALKRMIPEGRREDSWILQGLEGLHALLYQRPADERQAVEALLTVLTTPPNGFDTLRTLFEATSIFNGDCSAATSLNVVRKCRDFYSVYPQAIGPFFGLFFTSQFSGPRGGRFVEAPNLARSRWRRGTKSPWNQWEHRIFTLRWKIRRVKKPLRRGNRLSAGEAP